METVQGMAPVEEEGDFFIINIQGNEIYSGIVNDVLVVTNAKGYKDAVKDGHYENSLADSRFKDFSDGSLGIYANLNMEDYPVMLQEMLGQNQKLKMGVERFTDPFDYLGVSAGNYKNRMVVKTSNTDINQ